ncbi:Voltage-gated potassium channel subunit beta-1 [Lemmus lemmus]
MLAARTGAAGSQFSEDSSKFRKQSGLSSVGKDKSPKKAQENVKDSSLSPCGQSQLRARQLALLREVEMNWYLKLCELSNEHTTAHTTGMPHSLILDLTFPGAHAMHLYKPACADIPSPKLGLPKSSESALKCRRHPTVTKTQPQGACWPVRPSGTAEWKCLEKFLRVHGVSLQETTKAKTGMAYRKGPALYVCLGPLSKPCLALPEVTCPADDE